MLLQNDDHSDYSQEGTPLPLSISTTQVGTVDNSNDEDWFRVFIPNNSVYSISSLDIRACSESGSGLSIALFGSQRDASGRYAAGNILYNQITGNALTREFSNACPSGTNRALSSSHRLWTYTPGGIIAEGWYMIRIKSARGGIGRYYLSAGDDPITSISGPCNARNSPVVSNGLIPLLNWSDNMYQDVDATNPNRLFRSSGVLKNKDNPDWYDLDFTSTSMQGRYVTVDVIGLNGYATDTSFLDPIVELYWNTNDEPNQYSNGFGCNSSGVFLPILKDDDGGLGICEDSYRCQSQTSCTPDTSSHLAFRINRPVHLRLRVGSFANRTNFRPYQLWVDIKKQASDTTEKFSDWE